MAELESPLPRKERRAHRRPLPLPEAKFVPAGNPSLPTFVSLMLMITTFMIVLTSISLHENTRMRALMSGVRDTFALTSGDAAEGEGQTAAKVLGAAANGFQTSVPLAEVAGSSGGNRVVLTMPLSTVVDTTTKAATTEFEKGMAALVAALGKRPADLDYELELRFSESAVADAFAGALATTASAGGIDPARLFVSSAPGQARRSACWCASIRDRRRQPTPPEHPDSCRAKISSAPQGRNIRKSSSRSG
ncbi:MAG: hypothetical protein IPK59_13570 [Rhodospirillaceae bacterium]|nr:hypothetical protein [Rhodospirillaceae bacterium]